MTTHTAPPEVGMEPCPWCTSTPLFEERTETFGRISCRNEKCAFRPSIHGFPKTIVTAWNTRTPSPERARAAITSGYASTLADVTVRAEPSPSTPSPADREAIAKLAREAFEAALKETRPCERCAGRGYHLGFGEHGHDPDWCEVCGGCQFVGPTDDEAWLKAADAILAQLPRPAGWEGIETAPKDGSSILLFCPQGDGSEGSTYRVTVGSWCDEPGGTTEYRDIDGRWTGQDDHDGFTGWLSWDGGFSEDTMMPTHWMPLPAPPTDPSEQQEGK